MTVQDSLGGAESRIHMRILQSYGYSAAPPARSTSTSSASSWSSGRGDSDGRTREYESLSLGNVGRTMWPTPAVDIPLSHAPSLAGGGDGRVESLGMPQNELPTTYLGFPATHPDFPTTNPGLLKRDYSEYSNDVADPHAIPAGGGGGGGVGNPLRFACPLQAQCPRLHCFCPPVNPQGGCPSISKLK